MLKEPFSKKNICLIPSYSSRRYFSSPGVRPRSPGSPIGSPTSPLPTSSPLSSSASIGSPGPQAQSPRKWAHPELEVLQVRYGYSSIFRIDPHILCVVSLQITVCCIKALILIVCFIAQIPHAAVHYACLCGIHLGCIGGNHPCCILTPGGHFVCWHIK